MLVWGDNGPPVSEADLALIACSAAVAGASLATFRIARGWATRAYVVTILCFVSPLFSIAVRFWIGYVLR
jgi:hypothetical protein